MGGGGGARGNQRHYSGWTTIRKGIDIHLSYASESLGAETISVQLCIVWFLVESVIWGQQSERERERVCVCVCACVCACVRVKACERTHVFVYAVSEHSFNHAHRDLAQFNACHCACKLRPRIYKPHIH